jgi:hypothetical protein
MLIPQLALQNQQASESLEANARASLQRADWELEMGTNGANMSIALSDQLLYVVGMLLIVIYQDMRPDSYGSRTAKVDYLGRSVARLALLKENDAVRHDGDNTFALFSRVSGILFIIDRYNAIGNFGEYLLPLDCAEMLAQYSLVVSDDMYELARKLFLALEYQLDFNAYRLQALQSSLPSSAAHQKSDQPWHWTA